MKTTIRTFAAWSCAAAFAAVCALDAFGGTAVWTDGVSGNLTDWGNWGSVKPNLNNAAMMGNGQAHMSDGETFRFAGRFDIGAWVGAVGRIDFSGGVLQGSETKGGAMLVGYAGGTGTVDVVGGKLALYDYSDVPALSVGSGEGSAGTLLVRGGTVDMTGSGIVGASDGVGTISVSEGDLIVRGGNLSVGPSSSLTVSGGKVSFRKGGGLVVGSASVPYVGSRALMELSDGEVLVDGTFVCGENGDATVTVTGGRLSAARIAVGSALPRYNSEAYLVLSGGRIETAGFEAGATGSRVVTLAGGELVATAANDDFSGGIGDLHLTGSAVISNDENIVVTSPVTGPGGMVKRGVGTLSITGPTAWYGKTTVESGTLDMNGGMILGEISVNSDGGASIVHAKYDNINNFTLITTPWFDVSFAGVAEGTVLENGTGVAFGGGWGTPAVPDNAEAMVVDEGRRCLYFDTSRTESNVCFTTTQASSGEYVRLDFTVLAQGGAKTFELDPRDKGALMFIQTTEGGPISLVGYTAIGWIELAYADGTAFVDGRWYDARMEFDMSGGQLYVAYLFKCADGTYERLVSADGATIFPAAGVAGAVTSLAFKGVGRCQVLSGTQHEVDRTKIYYWIGGKGGKWSDGANWSHTSDGPAAGECPNIGHTAFVEHPAEIVLSASGDEVSSLVADAALVLRGGKLSVAKSVSGVSYVRLDGVTLSAAGVKVQIGIPLELTAGTENVLVHGSSGEDNRNFLVNGALRGSGTLVLRPADGTDQSTSGTILAGNDSAFSGLVKIVGSGTRRNDSVTLRSPASSSAAAEWEIRTEGGLCANSLFGLADSTYHFGSLKADFVTDGSYAGLWGKEGVTLSVGALDKSGYAKGKCVMARGGIDWIAPTAVFTNEVAGLDSLTLSGGGAVVLGTSEAVPGTTLSFTGKGGLVSFVEGADGDLGAVLAGSTAAMVFDDGGIDRTWYGAIADSNRGGFVKRGGGTLTWKGVPKYTGTTVVEDGVLVIPFGTRFDDLTLGANARVVLDMTGAVADAMVFSADSCNYTLEPPRFVMINTPDGYKYRMIRNAANGIVIVNGGAQYVWTGDEKDELWDSAGNWLVDAKVPPVPPCDLDAVAFPDDNCTTVRITSVSGAMSLSGYGNLHLVGSQELSTLVSFDLERDLEMAESPMSADPESPNYYGSNSRLSLVANSEFGVRSLSGSGSVEMKTGIMAVTTPADEAHTFVGTLKADGFVKRGSGTFNLVGRGLFGGAVAIEGGTLKLGTYRDIDGFRMDFDASDVASVGTDSDGKVVTWLSSDGSNRLHYDAGQHGTLVTRFFGGRSAVMLRPDMGESGLPYSRYVLRAVDPRETSRTLFVVHHMVMGSDAATLYSDSVDVNAGLVLRTIEGSKRFADLWSGSAVTDGIFTGLDYGSAAIADGDEYLTSYFGTHFTVGSGHDEVLGSATLGVKAAIGEIVAFTRELSHAEREMVSRQLMHKWGLGSAECDPLPKTSALRMSAGGKLDLGGQDITVASFSGAGEISNGSFRTTDGTVVQDGGALTLPAADGMTYVAYRSGRRLVLNGAFGKRVKIVIPKEWFAAGGTGKRMIFCECEKVTDITWEIERKDVGAPVDEGDGWWSLSGGGFTVRLR